MLWEFCHRLEGARGHLFTGPATIGFSVRLKVQYTLQSLSPLGNHRGDGWELGTPSLQY